MMEIETRKNDQRLYKIIAGPIVGLALGIWPWHI